MSSDLAKRPAYRAKTKPAPIGISIGIRLKEADVLLTADVVPGQFMGSHHLKVQIKKNIIRSMLRRKSPFFSSVSGEHLRH